ncbi:hypothetical protein [Frateuria defendens]|uniref:hypothetical protein n=1 Tax=Frateuria defendens TaxID=2219559 RepID=UPI00066FC7BD|nr:hypothetical protein [Frateuria defendens]
MLTTSDTHAADTADTGMPVSRVTPSWPSVLLQVLAVSGYGIWLLLGIALTLGIYRDGRGEALVPLTLGAGFVSLGLLAACLPLPRAPTWYGWRPGRGSWPTREALLALFAYLPMLAAAGLVRGDNDFWATRLAGAVLALCSAACLACNPCCGQAAAAGPREGGMLSAVGRGVSACYSGGLWLWLCLAAQDESVHPAGTHSWIMVLVALALLLGLIEGVRWQALQPEAAAPRPLRPVRFVAAAFTYALPCVALLLDDQLDAGPLVVGVAALSCLAGKTIEQRLYETESNRLDAAA